MSITILFWYSLMQISEAQKKQQKQSLPPWYAPESLDWRQCDYPYSKHYEKLSLVPIRVSRRRYGRGRLPHDLNGGHFR